MVTNNSSNGNQLLKTTDSPTFDHALITTPTASSAVKGAASSTDNALARFDSTSGGLIQNSELLVADTTGEITRATVGADLILDGNTIYNSDNQLTASDFPNATTLYGWNMDSTTDTAANSAYAGTKFGTDKDLTLLAQKLTASNDVLGNSKYNTIIAGGYLQSTDTVFNVANTADTDDFMVGGWVYIPDNTPAANVFLFSNTSDGGSHGWSIVLLTTGALEAYLYGATSPGCFSSVSAVGWKHIIYTREVGVGASLYINGVKVGSSTDVTVGTTQSKFQLGGYNGANSLPEAGTRYDECFFKKGVLPTNLDDVVKGIYARSAKKFAVKDANTNVFIPELNVASSVWTPSCIAGTNVPTVTGMPGQWSRSGNILTGSFQAIVDPTSAATPSQFTFLLPISCSATPTSLTGVAVGDILAQNGGVYPVSATQGAVYFTSTSAAAKTFYVMFQYAIN